MSLYVIYIQNTGITDKYIYSMYLFHNLTNLNNRIPNNNEMQPKCTRVVLSEDNGRYTRTRLYSKT